MPRIRVEIGEEQIAALDELARREASRSRAQVIREAIAAHLEARQPRPLGMSFGLWGRAGEDGLACQRRMREEW